MYDMPDVVSYLRVSTAKQSNSGLGLEAQRTYVENYCQRTDSLLLREFLEVESGRRCDRPILHQAISYAKRRKATLVIAKLDRLARNVSFIANLMETNVRFEACDIAGANNMTLHVMAAVAQNEAEAISRRTREALAAAKARGAKLGANNPASVSLSASSRALGQSRGQKTNRDRAIADNREVVAIMQRLRQEGLSLRQIAKQLNESGFVARHGGKWQSTQVRRALQRTQ